MSINVSQTSAARIVRAWRLSEADIERLVADFGIHPLDGQRLLTVPDRSGVERYRDYLIVSLLLPWPTAQGLVSLDIRLVVGHKFLIVVGDVPGGIVQRCLATIDPANSDQVIGHAISLILALTQATAQAVQSQAQHPAVAHELAGVRLAIDSLLDAAERIGLQVTADQRQQIALARHHLHLPAQAQAPEIVAPKSLGSNQRAVVGYVAVTAAVLLVTLLFRP